jgi:lipoprotein signal peptidase
LKFAESPSNLQLSEASPSSRTYHALACPGAGTFNLADIFIVGSAALLVLAAFRPGANGQQTGQGSTG